MARPILPTSTLSDVIRLVRLIFETVGDATPIMTGKEYQEDRGVGSAPRVLFVPNESGSCGPPTRVADVFSGSVTHGCKVYVRAPVGLDDETRFDACYALASRTITALRAAGAGRIVLKQYADASPTTGGGDGSYGAEIVFSFEYTHNLSRDPSIWALDITKLSPPDIMRPQGDSGKTFNLDVNTEGVRP